MQTVTAWSLPGALAPGANSPMNLSAVTAPRIQW